MSSTDLATWLLEQIAEDEQVARQIERPHWDTHDTHVDQGGHCAAVLSRNPDDQYDIKPVAWLPTFQFVGWDVPGPWANAKHIARWHPARVLAECEAKRELIAGHEHVVELWDQGDGPVDVDLCGTCAYGQSCSHCFDRNDLSRVVWPCRPLRLHALPYADRPGYLAEWAPE